MLKNIKPSFRKICYNFIIGAFFCTSFASVANADVCFVLDQDCIDNGVRTRMAEEDSVCSGYNESSDISTPRNGLKCEPCSKGGTIKYKCSCEGENMVRKGDHCVYTNDTVCPVADYTFDADRGAGWDCDGCVDTKSEQYGKYKCDCDEDHLFRNNTCVEDACIFLKGKVLVSNSTASSRENQNWVCEKCTASSNETKYYGKASCTCDGEVWGEYCIPAGRCVASEGYHNSQDIQCGQGNVVKRMNSGHYKGCYYCADDDSDVCPNPYTKSETAACSAHPTWNVIEADVTSTKGFPCFDCRQHLCNENEGYFYFESQCKRHYNIAWYENFDRMWAAIVNNLMPIKDALAYTPQVSSAVSPNITLIEDGPTGGYVVAVDGNGNGCPCPSDGPGSGKKVGQDAAGHDLYYDLSDCCIGLSYLEDELLDDLKQRKDDLEDVAYREYGCFQDLTTKCWYGKIANTDTCPEGTEFFDKLTCPDSRYEKVDSGETSAGSHTKCYECKILGPVTCTIDPDDPDVFDPGYWQLDNISCDDGTSRKTPGAVTLTYSSDSGCHTTVDVTIGKGSNMSAPVLSTNHGSCSGIGCTINHGGNSYCSQVESTCSTFDANFSHDSQGYYTTEGGRKIYWKVDGSENYAGQCAGSGPTYTLYVEEQYPVNNPCISNIHFKVNGEMKSNYTTAKLNDTIEMRYVNNCFPSKNFKGWSMNDMSPDIAYDPNVPPSHFLETEDEFMLTPEYLRKIGLSGDSDDTLNMYAYVLREPDPNWEPCCSYKIAKNCHIGWNHYDGCMEDPNTVAGNLASELSDYSYAPGTTPIGTRGCSENVCHSVWKVEDTTEVCGKDDLERKFSRLANSADYTNATSCEGRTPPLTGCHHPEIEYSMTSYIFERECWWRNKNNGTTTQDKLFPGFIPISNGPLYFEQWYDSAGTDD